MTYSKTLLCWSFFLLCICLVPIAHQAQNERASGQEATTTSDQVGSEIDEDERISQEYDSALERKKAQEKRRDLIVYTCFGLSLFILLWMRRKSKQKTSD